VTHKVGQDQAKYVKLAKPEHHCGPSKWDDVKLADDRNYCRHFIEIGTHENGNCKLVYGVIARVGGCSLFTRALPREKPVK
jgi:hypothetical protein